MSVRKAVLLAGGFGTRLLEETGLRPKPLIEIGGKPILWHIMKIFYQYGIDEFVVCLGYKGYMIKEYFSNYLLHSSDVTFDFANNSTVMHDRRTERWKVTLVDTGTDTMTGGRLKRIARFVEDGPFCMTYGDGVGDVDVGKLIASYEASKSPAMVTLVRPPGRFGSAEVQGDRVTGFKEKPTEGENWINAGFFVLDPSVLDLVAGDTTVWEREPLETLAARNQLRGFKHEGFWEPMDTLRDKNNLESLWASGKAPWRVWD
jgi:glucose-1-phosphate cytidylyltransferase